jgi:hypothetical protein
MPRVLLWAFIMLAGVTAPRSAVGLWQGQLDDNAFVFWSSYQKAYEKAVKSDDLRDWIAFVDDRYNWPGPTTWHGMRDPERAEYLERVTAAKQKIERGLFDKMVQEPSLSVARDYLRRFAAYKSPGVSSPSWIVTIDAPAERKQAMINMADPLAFEEAQSHNTIAALKKYLSEFPNAPRAPDAQARIAWMTENPAQAKIVVPREIKITNDSMVFVTTQLAETAGVVGYSVRGAIGVYDVNGRGWVTPWPKSKAQPGVNRGEITVPPSGSMKDTFYFRVRDSEPRKSVFCGGKIVVTWTGKDRYGNPIDFRNEIPIICT